MTRFRLALDRRVALAAALSFSLGAAGPTQRPRDAFDQPFPVLTAAQPAAVSVGRTLFNHAWTPGGPNPEGGIGVGRAQAGGRALIQAGFIGDADFHGLGPTYNRLSCAACHVKNGRGEAPVDGGDPLRLVLVRLSVPGAAEDGGPRPHPAYGDQLNDQSIPGVPPEGRAFFDWTERVETLADGTAVTLRAPQLRFERLAFGPLGAETMTSARMGPPVIGLGLLEAVPESAIHTLAAQQVAAGVVRGQANLVWDRAAAAPVLGRFGLKANAPTLRQQIAGAFIGDLGITSTLYPAPNCPPAQSACRNAVETQEGRQPELSDALLDALEYYLAALAPPPRRFAAAPDVVAGEALFTHIGCAACHVPTLPTAPHPRIPGLGGGEIHPFTDLLLHDMGDALADGRPDFHADGRQWRTPPLWGLGLTPVIADAPAYLHDGRARTPLEAILWHGGEAAPAAAAVKALSAEQRAALLAFLDSL